MWNKILLFYLKFIRKLNTPCNLLHFSFKKYLNRPYLIQPDKNLKLSYKDLGERAERLASYISSVGIKRGDSGCRLQETGGKIKENGGGKPETEDSIHLENNSEVGSQRSEEKKDEGKQEMGDGRRDQDAGNRMQENRRREKGDRRKEIFGEEARSRKSEVIGEERKVVALFSYNSHEYFELRAASHLKGFVFFSLPFHLSQEDVEYFLNLSKARVLFYRLQEAGDRLQAASCRLQDSGDKKQEEGENKIQDAGESRKKTGDGRRETGDRLQDSSYKLQATGERGKKTNSTSNFSIDELKDKFKEVRFVNLDSLEYARIFEDKTVGTNEKLYGNDIATYNLSSGTTGKVPKIVQLTNKNWVTSVFTYILNANIKKNQEGVFLCVVPYQTAGSTTFLPVTMAGLTYLVLKDKFSSSNIVKNINEYKVKRLYITPSWLIELFDWCKLQDERLVSLENIVIGTERISGVKLKEIISFFGPRITVGYGMVEVLPPLTMLLPKDYSNLNEKVLGSVGKVLKGVKLKIVDKNFKDLPNGCRGRIIIKSKTASQGYLDNDRENAKCFKDGWFYTNDYGYFDKNNYLYILGRDTEIISKDKELIFARDIEDKIHELSYIDRCVVVKSNEEVQVFVVLKGGKLLEEVVDEICGVYRGFGLVFGVKVVCVDKFPITDLGKLDRKDLENRFG